MVILHCFDQLMFSFSLHFLFQFRLCCSFFCGPFIFTDNLVIVYLWSIKSSRFVRVINFNTQLTLWYVFEQFKYEKNCSCAGLITQMIVKASQTQSILIF